MSQSIPPPMRWLERVSKDLLDSFARLREAAQRGGRLDERVKRLCLVAAYASNGCVECLVGCLREGLRMGLSLDEMLEAASLAVLASGARAVMTVHRALEILGRESRE